MDDVRSQRTAALSALYFRTSARCSGVSDAAWHRTSIESRMRLSAGRFLKYWRLETAGSEAICLDQQSSVWQRAASDSSHRPVRQRSRQLADRCEYAPSYRVSPAPATPDSTPRAGSGAARPGAGSSPARWSTARSGRAACRAADTRSAGRRPQRTAPTPYRIRRRHQPIIQVSGRTPSSSSSYEMVGAIVAKRELVMDLGVMRLQQSGRLQSAQRPRRVVELQVQTPEREMRPP